MAQGEPSPSRPSPSRPARSQPGKTVYEHATFKLRTLAARLWGQGGVGGTGAGKVIGKVVVDA